MRRLKTPPMKQLNSGQGQKTMTHNVVISTNRLFIGLAGQKRFLTMTWLRE